MELRSRTTGGCTGKRCGYNLRSKTVGCDDGDGSCITAMMVTAEESSFHDAQLQQASEEIQKILSGIKAAEGETRELSFLATRKGVMLAWVIPNRITQAGDLTATSDSAALETALGIKSAAGKAV